VAEKSFKKKMSSPTTNKRMLMKSKGPQKIPKLIKKRFRDLLSPVPLRVYPKRTPPPIRTPDEVYTPRRIRISKSLAGGVAVSVTAGDILDAATYQAVATQSCTIRVLGVKGWNITNSNNSSNAITITPASNTALNNVALGSYTDRGAGGESACVGFTMSRPLTALITCTKGSTVAVLNVDAEIANAVTSATQYCVIDMDIEVRF